MLKGNLLYGDFGGGDAIVVGGSFDSWGKAGRRCVIQVAAASSCAAMANAVGLGATRGGRGRGRDGVEVRRHPAGGG